MASNWAHLKDIVRIKGGKRLPKGSSLQAEPNDHPYIRVRDMGDKQIPRVGLEFVPDDVFPMIKNYIVEENDVIVSIVGSVGLVSVIDQHFHLASQTENCAKLSGLDRSDADYLYYCLTSPLGQREIAVQTVGAVQPKLPLYGIENIQVPWPDKPVRYTLASFLNSLDDKIELNRQINATLETMAQALFKSWFVDFDPVIDNALAAGNPIPEPLQARADKRAALLAAASAADTRSASAMDNAHPTQTAAHTQPGTTAPATPLQPLPADLRALFPDSFVFNEEMGWVPEGWEVKAMGAFCQQAIGGQWGEDVADAGLVPAVCLRGVDMDHLRVNGIAKKAPIRYIKDSALEKRLMTDNDFLIAASGAGPCGRPLWCSDMIQSGFQHPVIYSNFVKRFTAKSKEAAIYIDRLIFNKYSDGSIGDFITGTSVPNLDAKGLLAGLYITMPSVEVLKRFASFQMLYCSKLYSKECHTLEELRDALLPKLLSGQIQIPEAEKMAAEAL